MASEKAEPVIPAGKASAASSIGIEPVAADYGVNEGALLRKIDRHVLPGVVILYLLSFLDRSNVANAKLDGLTKDLHMTGNQYLTGLTLFFVGYIALEVVWNIILKRVGPKLWLPLITVVWGVVTVLQGVVVNMAGFFVIRTVLGLVEGGLFPGVVYLISRYYKRGERCLRVSMFFSAASLAGAFGGILAYGIGFMKGVGGKEGWAWIFIIEGLLTVVIGFAGFWFIPGWPHQAKFLTENETSYLAARLHADSDSGKEEKFDWDGVWDCLKDPKCWLYGFVFHTQSLPLYTLSLFLPTIIKALGYTAANAQLLTIPPYVLATILVVVYALISEHYKKRALFIIISNVFAIIGYIILLTNTEPTKRPGVSYVGVFFCAAGIYPSVALGLSWPAMNVSGQTKRAAATGLQITIGNVGAIIGTQLYRSQDTPRFIVGHSVALAYMVANIFVVSLLAWILRRQNKARDALPPSEDLSGEWKGDTDARWRFSY